MNIIHLNHQVVEVQTSHYRVLDKSIRRLARGAAGGRELKISAGNFVNIFISQGRRRQRVPGDTTPALLKTAGVDPRRNWDISVSFFLKCIFGCIFQHFQNKMAEIQGET